jgi:hypothetical protein
MKKCVGEMACITPDFSTFTGVSRTNLINTLSGKRATADDLILYICSHFKSPVLTTTGWQDVPKHSNLWQRLKEVSAILQMTPTDKDRPWLNNAVGNLKGTLAKKPIHYASWDFIVKERPVIKHPHMKGFVLDIPKENEVWNLIRALKDGDNPLIRIAVRS